jgi:hypothetical protein
MGDIARPIRFPRRCLLCNSVTCCPLTIYINSIPLVNHIDGVVLSGTLDTFTGQT